jgi:GNAT superfamily N-acetyltransferase
LRKSELPPAKAGGFPWLDQNFSCFNGGSGEQEVERTMDQNGITRTAITDHFMNIEPILEVRDVPATTRYYRDVLDFADVWLWGDPPSHGGANRDGVQMQFSLNPTLAETAEGRAVWIRVQNIATLYARYQEREAEIVERLEPKPWGVSEYTVRDLNGYRLRFAEPGAGRKASSDLPAEVRLESRVPTRTEMVALIRAVGWERDTNAETAPRVLEAALFGTVAVVDGQAIGCAFLTGDNAGFFYVRDVIVHPDWQRRHIGTALMDYARTHAPKGALVGLYTGTNLHEFYARFGFRGTNNGLYGMTQVIR